MVTTLPVNIRKYSIDDTDEEYLNKVKRPILIKNDDPEDSESGSVLEKTSDDEQTRHCCKWPRWFW